jgi:hypothetical protein
MTTAEIDPENFRPFADRAWNQTSAKACSWQLWRSQQGIEPVKGRPDRIESIDRRNRGSALHDFARLALKLLLDKGQWPNAERTMRAVLKAGAGKDIPNDGFSFMKGAGYSNLWDALGELVPKARLFMDKFVFSADDRIGSEHFVAIDKDGEVASFWHVPPGGYHGRIDWAELSAKTAAVPNQLRVIDFKNRPAIHSRAELKAHEQLSFYIWMLAKHYPQARAVPGVIGIYYFEYGITDWVELDWKEIDENVERLLARIRHKQSLRVIDIAPEPGFGRCQYCEYLGDCPAGEKLLDGKTSAPVDQATALEVAKGLFVADEMRDAARDGLKKYCEEHGAVMIADDSGFGFKRSPTYDYDPIALARVLKNSGCDLRKVMSVDMTEIKKLRRDNPSLDHELGKLITVRIGTKFEKVKPKRDDILMTPLVKEKMKTTKDKETKPKKGKKQVTLVPRSE